MYTPVDYTRNVDTLPQLRQNKEHPPISKQIVWWRLLFIFNVPCLSFYRILFLDSHAESACNRADGPSVIITVDVGPCFASLIRLVGGSQTQLCKLLIHRLQLLLAMLECTRNVPSAGVGINLIVKEQIRVVRPGDDLPPEKPKERRYNEVRTRAEDSTKPTAVLHEGVHQLISSLLQT